MGAGKRSGCKPSDICLSAVAAHEGGTFIDIHSILESHPTPRATLPPGEKERKIAFDRKAGFDFCSVLLEYALL
jgi:hypothetical protein